MVYETLNFSCCLEVFFYETLMQLSGFYKSIEKRLEMEVGRSFHHLGTAKRKVCDLFRSDIGKLAAERSSHFSVIDTSASTLFPAFIFKLSDFPHFRKVGDGLNNQKGDNNVEQKTVFLYLPFVFLQ